MGRHHVEQPAALVQGAAMLEPRGGQKVELASVLEKIDLISRVGTTQMQNGSCQQEGGHTGLSLSLEHVSYYALAMGQVSPEF